MTRRSLRHIRYPVRRDYLCDVFPLLKLAGAFRAGGTGGGIRSERRSRRTLYTGIHISAVVITDIGHVVTALHRAGEALEADVVGAAIATEGDKFDLVADLALLLERAVHSLDPGHGCSRVLKRAVHPWYLPCRIFGYAG